jgi:hypothetical protein
MNSASLCSLAGRYDNCIPTRLLAPIDFKKISALVLEREQRMRHYRLVTEDSIIHFIRIENGSAAISLLNKVCNSI